MLSFEKDEFASQWIFNVITRQESITSSFHSQLIISESHNFTCKYASLYLSIDEWLLERSMRFDWAWLELCRGNRQRDRWYVHSISSPFCVAADNLQLFQYLWENASSRVLSDAMQKCSLRGLQLAASSNWDSHHAHWYALWMWICECVNVNVWM